METEREGKFYRIKNIQGADIGRACIEASGSGFLVLETLSGVVMRMEPKVEGEPWGKVVADTDREPAGIGANDCPSCHGSGTAISHEPHTHSWPCGLCGCGSGREPHEN